MTTPAIDCVIVGAGAAGLATAIFLRRFNASRSVIILEGARKPGAKLLISGGARCNVTNAVVTEADFNGSSPAAIRRVLRALPVADTVAFFAQLGVPLHEEPRGKLFPDSNRSRDVLDALLRELERTGGELICSRRVTEVSRVGDAFRIHSATGDLFARTVVLATGGSALPKSGSDGAGFGMALRLGHSIVPTTPALVPLLLDRMQAGAMHEQLAGVTEDVQLDLRVDERMARRIAGPMLWTHFGVSGPAVLDMSRHWLRAMVDGRTPRITVNFRMGATFDVEERRWIDVARTKSRATVQGTLAETLPSSVASALLERLDVGAARRVADLTRDERRRIVHALVEWPLPVTGSRGYTYAEATAGGVPLSEIDPSTMASRVCPGLYLVGEILDVDGRLGGFNFQWAWASARAAGAAVARAPLG